MSKFILLVETGADLPDELAAQYGIYKVPMHVNFGDVSKDDETFPVEEVFSYLKKHLRLPQTSGCTPGDFETIFDKIHAEHPESHIIHLAYSAVTTCSYQSAVIAAEDRDYVTSIDTKHVTAGQTLVVLATARYLEAHQDAELADVLKKVEETRSRVHMGFFPGDLLYLKAGGRVSNAAYLGAKLLSLNPLIEINDGKLEATKKYRGSMSKVSAKLLNEFTETYHLSKDFLAFVYSEGLDEKIKANIQSQAQAMGFKEIHWIRTGCVVSTHSGPGAFGVCGYSMD